VLPLWETEVRGVPMLTAWWMSCSLDLAWKFQIMVEGCSHRPELAGLVGSSP